jgi:hypothetical protein
MHPKLKDGSLKEEMIMHWLFLEMRRMEIKVCIRLRDTI